MLSNQQNSQPSRDSFFGLISRKHRILFQQIMSGSSLQKSLLIFVLFAAASFSLTLGLVIYFGLKYSYSQTTCTKPECIIAANRLLEGMNSSADPCENFYEYVCGNWKHSHVALGDVNSWFIERSKFEEDEIENILKEKHSALDPKPVAQMKEFYKMCMDINSLNSTGLQPLYEVLDLLELPRMLPQPGISNDFNLAKVLAMSKRLLNLDIFIQSSTHFNSTSNKTFLVISPASPPKFSSVRLKEKLFKLKTVSLDDYLVHQIRYMTVVMREFTPGVNIDDISREAIKIILFDAQLKWIREETDPLQDRYFTFEHLEKYMFRSDQNLNSSFSWQDYVSTLIHGTNVSLQMNDTILVRNYKYFKVLGVNLMNLKQINFQRYVWWKIIDALGLHTTDQIRSHKFIFYEHVYNGITKYSRSLDCILFVRSTFQEVISYVFVKRNDVSNSAIKIKKIMSGIKNSLKQMIKNSVWMDSYTKEINVKKVDNAKVFIGYSEKCLNFTWLWEKFEKVDIIPNNFMSSLMNIHSVQTSRIINFINNSYDSFMEKDCSLVHRNGLNGHYLRDLNSIFISLGILQYPFFIDGVKSLNYGAVGFILGHELMHGFDNEGINFDWNGNERKLWNDNMTKAFNEQSKCFINQYQQYYIIDNKTIDGTRTLPENIADNEGLRAAFYAYEHYVAENGAELALPAFENFSHQQLLFMSFANKHYMIDVHSPHNSRIIGTLSNMPEFAKSWNCQPNVPMNPSNKCSLW